MATYHVAPHPSGWAVRGEGSEKAVQVLATQEEAIAVAKRVAGNQGGFVKIHRPDGTIRTERVEGIAGSIKVDVESGEGLTVVERKIERAEARLKALSAKVAVKRKTRDRKLAKAAKKPTTRKTATKKVAAKKPAAKKAVVKKVAAKKPAAKKAVVKKVAAKKPAAKKAVVKKAVAKKPATKKAVAKKAAAKKPATKKAVVMKVAAKKAAAKKPAVKKAATKRPAAKKGGFAKKLKNLMEGKRGRNSATIAIK